MTAAVIQNDLRYTSIVSFKMSLSTIAEKCTQKKKVSTKDIIDKNFDLTPNIRETLQTILFTFFNLFEKALLVSILIYLSTTLTISFLSLSRRRVTLLCTVFYSFTELRTLLCI